jgi:membrane associated rhomboid family serine protease
MDDQSDLPAAPQLERCYRHPSEETLVHCTRCGRPICPQCMIPAPVGHHCPECVAEARREFRQGAGRKMALAGFSFTKAILAAILAMYVIEVVKGGAGSLFEGPSPQQLFDLGATFPPAIALLGQYWRFVSSMFLHIGLIHLAFNCYALWLLGTHIERDFGRARFVGLYFLTGILGSIGSYAFGDPLTVSAGASGAVFGLMGTFLAYNYVRRNEALARRNLQWIWQILALNIFLAIAIRAIDYRAHIGGLIAGAVAGFLLDRDRVRIAPALRVLGLLALIGIGVALVVWRNADLRSQFPPDLFGALN